MFVYKQVPKCRQAQETTSRFCWIPNKYGFGATCVSVVRESKHFGIKTVFLLNVEKGAASFLVIEQL